jgi:hypothetical protein
MSDGRGVMTAASGRMLVWACAGALPAAAALACALPPDDRRLWTSDRRYELAYRFEPALVMDRHLSVIVAACPSGAPLALRIDATMPEHRHGMNYRPSVRETAPGTWRADGLLLHMPGRWEFRFELSDGERTARAVDSVVVE